MRIIRVFTAKMILQTAGGLLPPQGWAADIWRQFIKPNYNRAYEYLKKKGVIIMHHADSFMEPIVEDMVELGIDIWQGVLPQNDIGKLQTHLCGRMTLMCGIDSAWIGRIRLRKIYACM